MKILFLNKRPLFPTDDGGKVRTLAILRTLAARHDVTYLCNLQSGEEDSAGAMRELGVRLVTLPWQETPRNSFGFYRDLAFNVFARSPFTVSKDYDRQLRAKADELIRSEPFDLIVCDFLQMARNVIGLPGPPRLLFTHNVEAEIFRRHATTGPGWLRRRYMALQWRKMRRFEAQAGRAFDTVIAVSERDKNTFENDYGWSHVRTIDTAVDTRFYQRNGKSESPERLLFVGSLDWLPNINGVQFFVRHVWPKIRAARPQATFQIVGRNPDTAICRLNGHNGIEVAANVPDVRPYLSEAAVVVVPLLVGGGTRLKIFEAMAMEKTVVSTTLGAEGLKVTPGEHIELADDPQSFADHVVGLLADTQRRHRMARDAKEYVCKHFSAEMVSRQFEMICEETVGVDSEESVDAPVSGSESTAEFSHGSGLAVRR